MAGMIYRVALVGWMLKEAMHGPTTAKVLFVVNLVAVWLLSIVTWDTPPSSFPHLWPLRRCLWC